VVVTLLDYRLLDHASLNSPTATASIAPEEQPNAQKSQPPDEGGTESFLSQIFGPEDPVGHPRSDGVLLTAAKIILRLTLAALLAALLAFRPRKTMRLPLQLNPYLRETQILLAVVGAALMMIVADSAARAFGIFAAASLVRFRTNIRDPKEITVLLLSLGIGLATGVSRFELAIVFSVFSVLLLWVLERYEQEQVFRAMQLKVRTRSVESTGDILRKIFERHQFTAEVRELNREDEENPLGKLVYLVNVGPGVGTDELSEEIFSSDEHNIDSIEWDQKRGTSYIYR
jgi:uncharacterized membrane protein YhiD involved in acid resistance